MATDKCIWLCDLFSNTTDHKAMGVEETQDPITKAAFLEAIEIFQRGDPISPEQLPKMVYDFGMPRKDGKWRDVTVFGLWLLSERYAGVFRDFDMGLGALHPVQVNAIDKISPMNGDHFFFGAGSKKDAFLPDRSKNFKKSWLVDGPPLKPWFANENDLVFSSAALEGPDVWTDVSLSRAFFFSDRLVRAMKKAKVATKYRLLRCPVE